MAKLIQILTYVLIYIMTADNYIMTTDNCLLTIGILVGLIYVAAEFFIMQRRSHKLSSLSSHSNYLITRFIFILYDLGLFISLLVYTGTVTETDSFLQDLQRITLFINFTQPDIDTDILLLLET